MYLGRRGRANWYDLVIIALAAAMIFPDEVLDWIGARTGKVFNWRHVVLLEAVLAGLMAAFMVLLKPMYPQLAWWYPLPFVGFVAVLRGVLWLVRNMLGMDDS